MFFEGGGYSSRAVCHGVRTVIFLIEIVHINNAYKFCHKYSWSSVNLLFKQPVVCMYRF